MVAEGNDALLEEFFEKGTLPVEHILDGLREAVRGSPHLPGALRGGAPQRGERSDPELRRRQFPGPADRGTWKGTLNGKEAERAVKDSEPVSAFVFKTVADPFAGRVTYFKVISGVMKNDANLVNARTGGAERLAHIGVLSGKTSCP